MKETRRNIMVAIFVLLGMAVLGWLIIKFGDLPALVHRVDAHEITIYFPEAPGVQENTSVLFCGYPVGSVVSVEPPQLLELPGDPRHKDYRYQVAVVAAIGTKHQIPRNCQAKLFRRGLGSSFLEFVLEGPPSAELLTNGDEMYGIVSEASEFISEGTQRRLDELVGSLTRLSDQLQGQLTSLPPDEVDQSDPNKVFPNVTTAVMRLDLALKNINTIIGDTENQRNIKRGLADFAVLTSEMRQVVKQLQEFAEQIDNLTKQTSTTIDSIDNLTGQANEAIAQIGPKIQNVADHLAQTLERLDSLFRQMATGEGTAGRILYDAKLYEELAETTANLNLAIEEFRELVGRWKEKGILYKE